MCASGNVARNGGSKARSSAAFFRVRAREENWSFYFLGAAIKC
jgi:hypothetical protein